MKLSRHYEQLLVAMRRLVRLTDLRSRQLVRSHGLTGPQMLLIKELLGVGETTVSRLAERVSLSQATVTDILNRLEARGLIRRTRSEQDRRCVHISVTDSARETFHTSPRIFEDQFAARFSALGEREQLQLVNSLERIVTMMDPDTQAPIPDKIRTRKHNYQGSIKHDEHPPVHAADPLKP